MVELLSIKEDVAFRELMDYAYKVKLRYVGNKVFFRGIIEFGNICRKDCYYCGLRKSSRANARYTMPHEEIVECALWAFSNDYGSIVLQSGECNDSGFISFMEGILREIKEKTCGKLGITLSLGEQTEETYRKWFDAGAHRYLLRIESSNRELYKMIHPADALHDFDNRLDCIKSLGKIGYQTGTGVMIGLPGQTLYDLADDILFFKELDVDMIGMGPYIVHHETPLAARMPDFEKIKDEQFRLGLKMIAVTRIALKDVNIASTTALQALNPEGREMGLKAGANIIMPNITPVKYRHDYQLYEDKPCLDENASLCRNCLKKRIESIGEEIGYGEWGDSKHFFTKRTRP
ncbi:MAG: [FeFe] hydrogenase H-cluster radical SAM maturase HydE [Lentisphaerae bacterium GWF2_45_14]|nr:MAG: [FeFe] hydrogenase H-cluster radical SAM maturase HydE [Lentisphaerae bacterium GWF2_45_14]